jgi:hypothetical protein
MFQVEFEIIDKNETVVEIMTKTIQAPDIDRAWSKAEKLAVDMMAYGDYVMVTNAYPTHI